MKVVLVLMYALKVNILNIIVLNSRSHSISIQLIDSSLFEASVCTPPPDEYRANYSVNINMTEAPIL
jgi:hypothetical protein